MCALGSPPADSHAAGDPQAARLYRGAGRARRLARKARGMRPQKPPTADAPGVMRTRGWADYALLDSGDGRKLERYGPYTVVRPEPQCLWTPSLSQETWAGAGA